MADRRFDDDEMRAIFAQAAEASSRDSMAMTQQDGRTLEELIAIGREAGLDPAAVRAAARALESPVVPERRFLGARIGVGHAVQLDHTLTRDEWEQLVVLLRETFDARGVIVEQGRLRQWSNGNLQVLVEPTPSGDRVRMRTRNANAQAFLTMGAVTGVVTLAMAAMAVVTGAIGEPGVMGPLVPLGLVSVGSLGAGLLRLRGWAARRRAQMMAVGERLLAAGDAE